MADPKQLQISLPGAGKTQTYQLSADTPVHFNFEISEAVFTGNNGNLEIAIEGGGTVILEGYQELADAGTLPPFEMANGEVVAGDVYLFAFAEGDQADADLETAAGAATGSSGAGAYSDDAGNLYAGLDALGGQGDAYDASAIEAIDDNPENDAPVAVADAGEVIEQGDVDFNPGMHIVTTGQFTITSQNSAEDFEGLATLTSSNGQGTWFGYHDGKLGVVDSPEPPQSSNEGRASAAFRPPQSGGRDNPYIDNEGGETEAVTIDFSMPQNHVQIVLGGFNDWTDHNQDDASLIVTTVDGNTYTIGLGHSTQSGVLYDMGGNPVGTVEIGHNGQVTLNLTVDGSDSGSFIDSVEVSSGAAWWDPSSNDFYIDSITGGTYEPPAAWNDSSWDPTDWGLPADATPTFESYLQYLYPDEEGGFEGRFEAFMEDYGDAYFPLSGDGPSGFFLTYPDGPHSDVITTGNVIANDIDVDNDLDTLRMSSIDYVGSNEDADPTDGVDDGEIGTGVNPDGSLITGANEPGFDFDPTADPAAYVEVAGKYGTLRINALGDYEYILDPDLADHLEEGQVEQEVFEYTIVDPEGATSNTSTLTITVVGTNDAPVAVPDANDAIEKGDGIYTDPLGGDTPHDFTTVTEAKGNVLTDDLPGYDDPDDGSALDLDHDGDVEGDDLSVVGIYSHGTQTQQTFDIDRVDADGNPVTDGFGPDEGTDTVVDDGGASLTIEGQYGTLVISADGEYTYTPNEEATDFLNYGDQVQDTFTYMVMDEHGAIDHADLTITVHGGNDAPEAHIDRNVIFESTGGSNFDVATDDLDGHMHDGSWVSDNFSISAGIARIGMGGEHISFQAGHGWLTDGSSIDGLGVDSNWDISDTETDTGTWSNNTTQAMSIDFTDPMASVTVTLSAFFQNGPDGNFTELARLVAYDADGNQIGFVDVEGTPSGVLEVTLDGDSLGSSSLIDHVVVMPMDNGAGNAANNSDFLIQNVSGTTSEAVAQTHGNVLWNDTDVDNLDYSDAPHNATELSVVDVQQGDDHGTGGELDGVHYDFVLQGQYGTLYLQGDGSYTYVEDPDATDFLNYGDWAKDEFTYTVSDNEGGAGSSGALEDQSKLIITVLGSNDAPVASNDYNHLIEASAGESISVAAGGSNAAAIAAAWAADGVHIEAGGGWNFHDHFNANDWHQGTLTANDQFDGLGVNSRGDINDSEADTMDGNDFYTEALTITFDTPMDSVDITLSALFNSDSPNDDGHTEKATLIAYDADGNWLGSVTVYGTESGMATGHFDADALGADIARVVAVPDSNHAGNSENNSDFYIHAVSGEPGQVGSVVDGNVIDGFDWFGEHHGADTDVDNSHEQLFVFKAWAGDGNGHGPGSEHAVTVADFNPFNNNSVEIQGQYGTLTLHEDGSYTYEENPDLTDPLAKGTYEQDVFTYEVADGRGGTDTATLTIGILGTNDAPEAQNDYNHLIEAAAGESVSVAAGGSNAAAIAAAWAADGVHIEAGGGWNFYGHFNANDWHQGTLTANDQFDGLGVNSRGDIDDSEADTMDGNDFYTEALTITFDTPMDSVDITLSALFNSDSPNDGGNTERALLIAYDADGNQLGTVTVYGTESGMATGHFDADALGADIARVVAVPDSNGAGNSENNSDFYIHAVSGEPGQVGSVVDGNVIDGFNWYGEHYGTDTDVDTPHDQLFITRAWAGEGDGTGSGAEGAEDVADHNPHNNNSVEIQGEYGLLTIHEDGSYTYEENTDLTDPLPKGSYEQDVFTYEVSDGQGGTDTATLTIGIHGTNDAPVAQDDYNGLTEATGGESIAVAADGSNAAAIAAAWAADGVTVTAGTFMRAFGSFNPNSSTLTANDNFDGLGVHTEGDINDGEVDTLNGNDFKTEALSIGFEQPMDSVDITLSALFNRASGEDGWHTERALLIAYDADGNQLGTVTVRGTESGMATGHFDSDALGGDIARVVVMPDANSAGDSANNSDFYVHSVSGQTGQVGSVVDGNVIDGFDWHGGHYGTDTDVDTPHDQLFVTKAWAGEGDGTGSGPEGAENVADHTPYTNNSVQIQGQYGLLTLHEDGSYTYEENPDLTDPLAEGAYEQDVFTYEVSDGQGGTDTATLTIGIHGTNDAAIITESDVVEATEDHNVNYGFIVASGTLDVSDVDNPGQIVESTQWDNHGGKFEVNADGEWTYTVPNGQNGSSWHNHVQTLDDGETLDIPGFTVTTDDGTEYTVHPVVNGINDAPVAFGDALGGSVEVHVTNFAEADGQATWEADGMTFTAMRNGHPDGHLVANDDGYEGKGMLGVADYGDGDPIDGNHGTDSVRIDFDHGMTSVTIGLSDYADSGKDWDDVNFVIRGTDGTELGTVEVRGTDTHVFTFTSNDTGGVPIGSIEVQATDDTDNFYIDYVNGDGDMYFEDGGSIELDASQILGNDFDVDIEDLTIGYIINQGPREPVGGDVTLNPDGSVTFTPDANFHGEASFWYRAYDGTELSNPAKVTIQIAPVNDAPVANPDTDTVQEYDGQMEDGVAAYPTAEGNLITDASPGDAGDSDNGADTDNDLYDTPPDHLSLLSVTYDGVEHDFAPNSDTLSFDTEYGQITFNKDGSYTYEATEDSDILEEGENGTESFTYVVQDDAGATSSSTLTITVEGLSDDVPPVAVNDVYDNNPESDTYGHNVVTEAGVSLSENPSDYLLIVDTSGSMHDTYEGAPDRMTPAKDALKEMIETLQDSLGDGVKVRVGIIDYDDDAGSQTFELTGGDTSDTSGYAQAIAAVNALTAGGGTDYTDAFNKAIDWVGDGGTPTEVVFISDGEPHFGYGDSYNYTQEWKTDVVTLQGKPGVHVTAVGIEMDTTDDDVMANMNLIQEGDEAPTMLEDVDDLNDILNDILTTTPTPATTAEGNVLDNDYDEDNPASSPNDGLSVIGVENSDGDAGTENNGTFTIVGKYGTLTIGADGEYSYTPDQEMANALNDGETGTDTFTYTIEDATGLSNVDDPASDTDSEAVITFLVNGANDAATITVETDGPDPDSDTGAVWESNLGNELTASGTLTVNDPDTGQSEFDPASVQDVGGDNIGTLTINADGEWEYTISDDNAVFDNYDTGESFTETFSVASADGTATHEIVVTVNGLDDNTPPVGVNDTGTRATVDVEETVGTTMTYNSAQNNNTNNWQHIEDSSTGNSYTDANLTITALNQGSGAVGNNSLRLSHGHGGLGITYSGDEGSGSDLPGDIDNYGGDQMMRIDFADPQAFVNIVIGALDNDDGGRITAYNAENEEIDFSSIAKSGSNNTASFDLQADGDDLISYIVIETPTNERGTGFVLNSLHTQPASVEEGRTALVWEGNALQNDYDAEDDDFVHDVDFGTNPEDGELVVSGAVAGDHDADHGSVAFTAVDADGVTIAGQHGTLEISANGEYTYTPNDQDNIHQETFTYEVRDTNGAVDYAVITVGEDNAPPVAVHDGYHEIGITNSEFSIVDGSVSEGALALSVSAYSNSHASLVKLTNGDLGIDSGYNNHNDNTLEIDNKRPGGGSDYEEIRIDIEGGANQVAITVGGIDSNDKVEVFVYYENTPGYQRLTYSSEDLNNLNNQIVLNGATDNGAYHQIDYIEIGPGYNETSNSNFTIHSVTAETATGFYAVGNTQVIDLGAGDIDNDGAVEGNVLANDFDADTDPSNWSVTEADGADFTGSTTIHGDYGSLTIDANGDYTYTPYDEAAASSHGGTAWSDLTGSVNETFEYTMSDGNSESSAHLEFSLNVNNNMIDEVNADSRGDGDSDPDYMLATPADDVIFAQAGADIDLDDPNGDSADSIVIDPAYANSQGVAGHGVQILDFKMVDGDPDADGFRFEEGDHFDLGNLSGATVGLTASGDDLHLLFSDVNPGAPDQSFEVVLKGVDINTDALANNQNVEITTSDDLNHVIQTIINSGTDNT